MAGRDNVLFHASVASGATAGTVVPLSLLYGVENIRTGYGTPVLKNARALYAGCYSGTAYAGIPIEIKNSNWVDSAGLVAQLVNHETSLNRDSLAFMRGRDKVIAPNTAWYINAELPANTTAAGDIYVLLEIEYSDVPGFSTENRAGSPIFKKCSNASVTGSANTLVSIGTFDNLLQGVTYLLSEASMQGNTPYATANFLVVEGFANQRGLIRIIPIKNFGLADQVEGSVYLTKQTYNISLIRSAAMSAEAVTVGLELLASAN